MSGQAESRDISRYPLRFGATAFLIVAVTLVLVLFVLPERYVLSPGFRESGISFPSPSTPFAPVAVTAVPPRPLPVSVPVEAATGPAEALWDEVVPLRESDGPAAALPLFERYLDAHPEDVDVRRELAVTLLNLGREVEAVEALRALLDAAPDEELELLLARALRDIGRLAEASRVYEGRYERRPDDEALALEWARAHAWSGEHRRAVDILSSALARRPGSTVLRMELVRAHFALGDLHRAVDLLATLEAADALDPADEALALDVIRALIPPVLPVVVAAPRPPTVVERAMAARLAGDTQRARSLLEEELAARPEDRGVRLALADLLEFELADMDGARSALLEAERLGPLDLGHQVRLARLDIWTGGTEAAETRLRDVLAALDRGAVGSAAVRRGEVLVLLGDLRRWAGERAQAAALYERALAADPTDARARVGLAALEDEVERQVAALEAPGVAGTVYSFADTDEFVRVDAGGTWADVADGGWVWEGAGGRRWLEGYDLAGLQGSREGLFLDLGLARWWRWGTLRTGLRFGAQHVRTEWDILLAASLRHRSESGGDTEVRLERGPAYPLTSTLQSVLAEVVQETVSLTHARPLSELWSALAAFDAARLRVPGGALPGDPPTTERLQLGLSAGRRVSGSLTLGVGARGVAFTHAAPTTPEAGGVARPLFWDPRWALSLGPFAALDHELGHGWSLVGRLDPGIALLHERRPLASDPQLLLQASIDAGVRYESRRWSTGLQLFHYQGRFDGYRGYGARVTVGARSPSSGGQR